MKRVALAALGLVAVGSAIWFLASAGKQDGEAETASARPSPEPWAHSSPSTRLFPEANAPTTGEVVLRGAPPHKATQPHAAANEFAGITGQVRDATSGQPVAGVTVSAWVYRRGRIGVETISDAYGRYEFARLPFAERQVHLYAWGGGWIVRRTGLASLRSLSGSHAGENRHVFGEQG